MATTRTKCFALLASALFSMASAVYAQDSGPLLDLLVKKGIINDQEAENLRAELVKDFAANTSAGKLNLGSTLTELRISGDVRLRYEYREGENSLGDHAERERFRYRLRPTITGNLGSDWSFGFRLENSAKSRSSNVTVGDDNPAGNTAGTASNGPGNSGPFGKANDGLFVGQVYIAWKPTTDFTVWGGRMPNPFTTTLMVWDADINPEGFAEQYRFHVGKVDLSATAGQFFYDSASTQNVFGATGNKRDQYLLGWQLSAKWNLPEGTFVQIAPTLYNYVNNGPRAKNFGGTAPFSSSNLTGINNLTVWDVPVEYDFPLVGTPSRIFGDFAYNSDANARATKYGRSDLKGEDKAYQIGFQYGKAKLKGEWDARVLYQATGLFALDQNLVDSDIFDSRVNMKGFVFGVNYQVTDAVTATMTYATGKRKNGALNTALTSAAFPAGTPEIVPAGPGENDISTLDLNKYNLVQADIVVKF